MSEASWAVVIIAVAGLLTTVFARIWHERRRWQHERREHFRDERSRTYADYLTASQLVLTAAQTHAGQRRALRLAIEVFSSDLESQRQETERTLQEAIADMTHLLSVMRLISSDELVSVAVEFMVVLAKVDPLVNTRSTRPDDWQPVIDKIEETRRRFVAAARAELEVSW